MRTSRIDGVATGRLWLAASALELMIAEAQRSEPLETGGVLLGWTGAERDELLAAAMLGPGPKATHKRARFSPDAKWQDLQIAAAYEASGRTHTYLGDWHSHPGGGQTPSRIDQRTGKRISRSRTARAPRPLVVILSGRASKWRPIAYRYLNGRLLEMDLHVTAHNEDFDRGQRSAR